MRFDPFGLGYTRRGAALHVHYPARHKDGALIRDASGALVYDGAGWPFDHRPEIQRTPDSERATLWRSMFDGAA